MGIIVRCACGRQLRVKEEHAGRRGRCPACGETFIVPAAAAPPSRAEAKDPDLELEAPAAAPPAWARPLAAAEPALPSSLLAGAGRSRNPLHDRLYLVLLAALLPLVLHSLSADDVAARFERTCQAHPDRARMIHDQMDVDELLAVFPDDRLEGAAFRRDTFVHWLFGIVAAAGFLGLGLVLLRSRDTVLPVLLGVMAFTATVGILMLIAFQYVAEYSQGWAIYGRSIVVIVFWIVKFIGYSYAAADDPSNGFLLSFVGFTCGVGLCEELVKAVPLVWHFRRKSVLSWRGACVWGLVSGAGFGVAEGIMYSSRYYNGITAGGIYWVRFISCVGLHAIWAAAVALSLYGRRDVIQGADRLRGAAGSILIALAAPMVLHGLYDTLLKKDLNALALAVAAASFVWLGFLIERAIRHEPEGGLEPMPAAA